MMMKLRGLIIAFMGIVLGSVCLSMGNVSALTINFDHSMYSGRNMQQDGKIQYYVTGNAKKYDAAISKAANKWNRGLGSNMFVKTSSIDQSQMVIATGKHVVGNNAGMSEINSGVLALNNTYMKKYNSRLRQAVILHEFGHFLGTKDLYHYNNMTLKNYFMKNTVMGGNYRAKLNKLDIKIAKASLAQTPSITKEQLQRFRNNNSLYYQKFINGIL